MLTTSRIVSLVWLLSAGFLAVSCHAQAPLRPHEASIPEGYKLVWSDEFDKPGLPDRKKWDYDLSGNQFLHYHNERQYYTRARKENTWIEDGALVITARNESMTKQPDWKGQEYSSGKLITKNRQAWKYGFFDIRAKLPCGRGIWPAIWMLSDSGGWPKDGEIDIMESVGFEIPTKIHGTLHNSTEGKVPAEHGSVIALDACQTFHNYQLDWREGSITVLVDGKAILHEEKGSLGYDYWPYDHRFYLLLNVAVGGAWGAQKGIDPSIFPQAMTVDYVRVYQAQ